MEEKQMMTNEQLETELRSLSRRVTLGKILVYGSHAMAILCFFMAILCFFMQQILLAVIFLMVALIGKKPLKKDSNRLKQFLGDYVVSVVLNEVFDNVDYNPFGRIDSIDNTIMLFPFCIDEVQGSDHIKATYKGLQVELSDITIYEEYYDSDNDRREQKVFQGQWLICDFGKELSSDVRISANNKRLRKRHKKDSVGMKNVAFNERFLVTARNAQEAYRVLTPHMMECILTMADKSGGNVYMSFLRDGKLHIAVQTKRDFFELGKRKTNINALRQKFLSELKWFTDIIDTLRVEDTSYKKINI